MRNYPDHIITQHMLAEDRYQKLTKPALRTTRSKSTNAAIMTQAATSMSASCEQKGKKGRGVR